MRPLGTCPGNWDRMWRSLQPRAMHRASLSVSHRFEPRRGSWSMMAWRRRYRRSRPASVEEGSMLTAEERVRHIRDALDSGDRPAAGCHFATLLEESRLSTER